MADSSLSKYHTLTTLYFFIQGIGSLLPWNGVLSTLDFYNTRYPDGKVYFVFPMATLLSSIAINFFMVSVKSKFSINFRIAYCNLLIILLLIMVPSIAILLPETYLGYWLILFTLFLTGTIGSITNGSLLGLAGYFPSKHMSEYNTGTGVGGIIPNLLRIMILLLLPDTSNQTDIKGIVIYYGISLVFLLSCVGLHFKFINSKDAKDRLPAFGDVVPRSNVELEKAIHTKLASQEALLINNDLFETPAQKDLVPTKSEKVDAKENFRELMGTFKETWSLNILMAVSMTISLTLFPGVMLMNPLQEMNSAWKVVLLELAFNFCDTLGKFVTFKSWMVCAQRTIFMLILARLGFFFTYIVEATTVGFPVIGETWFAFLNTALFGLTNGYACGVLFILGPKSVEGKKKETVGFCC